MRAFKKANLVPDIENVPTSDGGNKSHLSSVRHFVIEQVCHHEK